MLSTYGSSANPSTRKEFLIAVDFGTTYSGLAWAQIQKPKNTFIVDQWPDQTTTDEKTPTTLQYSEDGSSYSWGCQVDEQRPRHEWFKLGLEDSRGSEQSELASKYPTIVPAATDDIPCEKLVIDYLTALREHAQATLASKFGPAIVERTPIRYIVTIPAVWTDKAKDKTRQCAQQAGMGLKESIQLIPEPEAAAVYELKERADELQAGDTFVICDAGGGTVDLISYRLSDVDPIPSLEEATSGSGKACGSTFLNRIFADFLKRELGDDPDWDDEVLFEALNKFESVKKKFRPEKSSDYFIPVLGLGNRAEPRIRRGMLQLTAKDLKPIFDPVVNDVIKLVKDQIYNTNAQTDRGHKKVKAVLLVGGFGQSVYLKDRLKKALGTRINVLQGMHPLSAVVRGALLCGLSDLSPSLPTVRVQTRRARKHFGTECWTLFDETIHDPTRRGKNAFKGEDHIATMNWFIEKEDEVQPSVPRRLPFYLEKKKNLGRPRSLSISIYSSTEVPPPRYKNNGCFKLADVTADLSSIAESQLKCEPGADKALYYKLDFFVVMTCHAATTSYCLEYEGKQYDVITTEYV